MNVRFTPKSGQSALQQLGSLLDHLVGERQKIHRQLDTRGLCGSTAGVCAGLPSAAIILLTPCKTRCDVRLAC